jgi:hypothetical protein
MTEPENRFMIFAFFMITGLKGKPAINPGL